MLTLLFSTLIYLTQQQTSTFITPDWTRGAHRKFFCRRVSSESRASSCILLAVIRDYSQSNWQSENVKSDDNLDFQIKHTLNEIIVSLSNHDDEGDKNEPILHV